MAAINAIAAFTVFALLCAFVFQGDEIIAPGEPMICSRHRRVGLGVVRINPDRFLELLDAPPHGFRPLRGFKRVSPAVETVKAAKVGVVRLRVN